MKNSRTTTVVSDNSPSSALEPRVVKLETGLDRLVDDVRDLAGVVRSQGAQMEAEIQKLVVAVTQASGPKKTDWGVIISSLFLVMAVGSAVFWPLNQISQNNKSDIQGLTSEFKEHKALDSHPVSTVLLKALDTDLRNHILFNQKEMNEHDDRDRLQFDALDKKLQTEYSLMNAKIETLITGLDTKLQLEIKSVFDMASSKIKRIDGVLELQDKMDLEELRAWRNKASGLSAPSSAVALIPKEVSRSQPSPPPSTSK